MEHVGRMGSSPFEAASFEVALDEAAAWAFPPYIRCVPPPARRWKKPFWRRTRSARKTLELPAIITSDSRPAARALPRRAADLRHRHLTRGREAARAESATRIYMTTDALDAAELSPADAFEQGIVPVLDEVCRAVDHECVDPWILAGTTVAVGNISELALAAQVGATAEIRSCLPVHNTPCMEALAERGAGAFCSHPRSRSTRLSRLAPPRPQPWASPFSAARAL